MATIPHRRHTRNCRPLAQGRFPYVLEANLQGQGAGREEQTPKEGQELIFRIVVENPTWQDRASMGSSSCSALIFPSEPSPVG